MQEFKELEGMDFESVNSKNFEDKIVSILSNLGKVRRQVVVNDRGDGRRGRIDIVAEINGKVIAIEIDRKSPRKKSIFKLHNFDADERYTMTRSPFSVSKI